ncbi:MAG TPA: SGNH/GDSL hydrolase family protein [Planctomycetota bacterium]|nr:SGNH/GDSL hydrolase family protein [Planctomycetota bacterium]
MNRLKHVGRVVLLLLSVTTSLLVAEWITSTWLREGLQCESRQRAATRALLEIVERDGVRFRARPNARVTIGAVECCNNELGLRGASVGEERAAGTFRVLCIGDSTTYGLGVPEPATWVRRLEADLNSTAPSGLRIEVVNAGVPAYNTRDELALYRSLADRLRPDLVVLGFYGNDLERLGFHVATDGSVLPDPFPVPDAWNPVLLRSWLFRRVCVSACEWMASRGTYVRAKGDNLAMPARWLHEMAQEASARRTPFAIFEIPTLAGGPKITTRLDPSEYPDREVSAWLAQVAAREEVPFLSLVAALSGPSLPRLRISASDQHPNAFASQLMATAIGAFLRERRLVPAAP